MQILICPECRSKVISLGEPDDDHTCDHCEHTFQHKEDDEEEITVSGTMVGGKIVVINETQESQLKEYGFSVGDKVDTPYGLGEVWKVTEASVHVKHYEDKKNLTHNPLFSKYLKDPYHHSQKPISSLNHV